MSRSSLMHVGRRVDYALRALAYLAGQPPARLVGRAEIEAHQAIPRSFLAKILRRLVDAGVLESVAGARGGFRLRASPERITVRAVYEAVEGELRLIDCLRGDVCRFDAVCSQFDVWRGAEQRLRVYLDSISIADLAAGDRPLPHDLRERIEVRGPSAGGGAPAGGGPLTRTVSRK